MSACYPARSGFYRSYHEIICRSQQISARSLSGPLINLYPLKNQCRISLIGSASPAEQNTTRWQYEVVMPLMLIGQDRAERTEMHLPAELVTPLSEETMRFGCQLSCECDLFPRCAVETAPGVYRIAFDARIALYSTLLCVS